ncbi:Prophage antirepressor [Orenia metallireducens]|uniref:Prophage antirepressor n=1 Tax=Orenia metallireducens TaxID=1413210 RepID=A0A285G6M2_9FIRM|nr:phage antirepressor KilAC domain-containing protein [Orenia metallireducens]SNY19197.1 Prophage antirepressor [Orenia metallireducens]
MSDIKVFDNEEFGQVRVVTIKNNPYVVGNDIAKALDYKRPYEAVTRHCDGAMTYRVEDSLGRKQSTKIIPEGDIYRLIVKAADQSQNLEIKKKAKKFERWVFDEVLPSIRKHGMYAKDEILDNPDLLIEVATKLKQERAERQRLEIQNKKKDQIIGELKPKADYTDRILQNKGLVNITQIAKDYGMSGRAMNDLLHELGIQYKQSDQWLLYAKYQGKGYTHSKTFSFERSDGTQDVKMNTKWTQKGRLFLYELLKKNGVLPTIEDDLAKSS